MVYLILLKLRPSEKWIGLKTFGKECMLTASTNRPKFNLGLFPLFGVDIKTCMSSRIIRPSPAFSLSELCSLFSLIRSLVADFGTTLVPLCTPHDSKTCAGDLSYLPAIFRIVGSVSGPDKWAFKATAGAGRPPRGECAVTWIPCAVRKAIRSCWGRYGCSSIWFIAGRMRGFDERRRLVLRREKLEIPIDFVWPVSTRSSIARQVDMKSLDPEISTSGYNIVNVFPEEMIVHFSINGRHTPPSGRFLVE